MVEYVFGPIFHAIVHRSIPLSSNASWDMQELPPIKTRNTNKVSCLISDGWRWSRWSAFHAFLRPCSSVDHVDWNIAKRLFLMYVVPRNYPHCPFPKDKTMKYHAPTLLMFLSQRRGVSTRASLGNFFN